MDVRETRCSVTCARGTRPALLKELGQLGIEAQEQQGVVWLPDLAAAYAVLMHSRVASRVLLPIAAQEGVSADDDVYEWLRTLPFEQHFGLEDTFAIDVSQGGGFSAHARFLAQRCKDALVDRFRDQLGDRPSVDTRDADLRFHLHWAPSAFFYVDLGGPLHRRGYRPAGAEAPLRETLAAALIILSDWDQRLPLLDPMCGSGTLLVEAALMALRVAPGLIRSLGPWRFHDRAAWQALRQEADGQRLATLPAAIAGRDRSAAALRVAKESLRRAGVQGVELVEGAFRDATPHGEGGVIVSNPPYGERLGERGELVQLYPRIGDGLKARFGGWSAHFLVGDRSLASRIGLRPKKKRVVHNGALECVFVSFDVRARQGQSAPRRVRAEASMFENRLRKNLRRLGGWAKGGPFDAYRLYDADIPEYNVAIDRYGDAVLLSEFRRPHAVAATLADARLHDALMVTADVLGVPVDRIHVRERARQRASQYEKRGEGGAMKVVREGRHRFFVNLEDYLDTGLFLDHRDLRRRMAKELKARGDARFLNLFAYTCTASVYAAAVGARTTSVDLSGRYLRWGEENFELNEMSAAHHRFERADGKRWLSSHRERYELIFLAPPSYSRSKSVAGELDLRRDHALLIEDSYGLLAPGGTLYFSSHARGLKLDARLADLKPESIDTTPRDFKRGAHQTWRFQRDA
ncbi:MAG: bifunctional 23S rRNA (guanine(2069)-N(7))-methyltransferase RlmK/23S rRNA (guanine(2445)-N(2))-methyltransferase RlmL [Myxococcota bacterium]